MTKSVNSVRAAMHRPRLSPESPRASLRATQRRAKTNAPTSTGKLESKAAEKGHPGQGEKRRRARGEKNRETRGIDGAGRETTRVNRDDGRKDTESPTGRVIKGIACTPFPLMVCVAPYRHFIALPQPRGVLRGLITLVYDLAKLGRNISLASLGCF